MNRPVNHNKYWSTDEEALLLKYGKAKRAIADIAAEFKRTEGAIRAHQELLAVRMVNQGKTNEEVANATGLTVCTVELALINAQARKTQAQNDLKSGSYDPKAYNDALLASNKEIRDLLVEIRDLLKLQLSPVERKPTDQP
jgi:hypothetical protein